MNISSKPQSFTGRCQVIKDADSVCRSIKNVFCYVSPSKINEDYYANITKIKRYENFLNKKNTLLKEYRNDRKFLQDSFKFCKEVLLSTEKAKVANCYELATVTEIALRINGVKNCGRANVYTSFGENLDHCVTYINLDNKIIPSKPDKILILDSWLGEVDFFSNMETKYKNTYNKYFNISTNDGIMILPKKPLALANEQINILRDKYPSLLLKKHCLNSLSVNA